MKGPALVVMAAGVGNRYGGLKQLDPVGPNDEKIIDYSVYDAICAGFKSVVFIIRKSFENEFKEKISRNFEHKIDVFYVHQELDQLPKGFMCPETRKKPWGTGQAVMLCQNIVNVPFCVINADDFYGRDSFVNILEFLESDKISIDGSEFCMSGYVLKNTLSDHGHVARGVCEMDGDNYLKKINELTKIKKFDSDVKYTMDEINWIDISKNSVVSMNMWGFTPIIFEELKKRFRIFLKDNLYNIKSEYLLPEIVGQLITEHLVSVKVLNTKEKWFGVTYKDDKPLVQGALSELVKEGVYPAKLWS